ncbi:MAG TPA: hypothetical protein EYP65_01710, partial [Armatimonadetes bacterium]|nr:hypothetical protein [Armatimonadota bacterium]
MGPIWVVERVVGALWALGPTHRGGGEEGDGLEGQGSLACPEGGGRAMRGPKVVAMGGINFDLFLYTGGEEGLPEWGKCKRAKGGLVALGGRGANQAVQAARLGAEVYLVGKVGSEPFMAVALERLKMEGVDTRFVFRGEGPSGMVAMFVFSGEAGSSFIDGANLELSPKEVRMARGAFEGAGVALLQVSVNPEAYEEALRLAKECGAVVIADPSPADMWRREWERLVDVIVPNRMEAEQILGREIRSIPDAVGAAREFCLSGCKVAVITLGEEGAVYCV